MTATKRITRSRPSYFRGQLLDETDFHAEQKYQRDSWRLHLTKLHTWGVVDGLQVSLGGQGRVVVAPGLAIDSLGHEIELTAEVPVDLAGFASSDVVYVTLAHEEEPGELRQSETGEPGAARMTEYAVVSVGKSPGVGAAVTLARVKLSPGADEEAVSYAETTYASSLIAPGRIGYRELEPQLQSGWVRLPFKPFAIDKQPAFLIGPTEAKSGEGGAAGSMAIPVPPGVTQVNRFRLAGEKNDGDISVEFFRCGWDPKENDHEYTPVHSGKFNAKSSDVVPAKGKSDSKIPGAFKYTGTVNTDIDPEYHALSVVITASARSLISLVAVEFAFPGAQPYARR